MSKPRRRTALSGRHEAPDVEPKTWVQDEKNQCLKSIAVDVYEAEFLAMRLGAHEMKSCKEKVNAANKSKKKMEDSSLPPGKRCAEGSRAERKFWEAKTRARRGKL